jgi:hypothetical protein
MTGQPNAALVCYTVGLAGGGGAASPPARVCAREVTVLVLVVDAVMTVVGPRHLRLAFARGR